MEKPAVHSRDHAERLTTIHTRVHAANFQDINQPDGSTTVGIEPTTLLAARRQRFTAAATPGKPILEQNMHARRMIMILNYMSPPEYLIKFAL